METLQHKFVEYIPEKLDERTLYISVEYRTAVHKCVCGCGNEVVTPFSPTDWELKFHGDSVSLSPSIGNWGFKCKSHYWIVKNRISHCRKWSDLEIASGRDRDKRCKDKFYTKRDKLSVDTNERTQKLKRKKKFWKILKFLQVQLISL